MMRLFYTGTKTYQYKSSIYVDHGGAHCLINLELDEKKVGHTEDFLQKSVLSESVIKTW